MRKRKNRELTLGAAARWSLAAAVILAVAIGVTLVLVPETPENLYFQLQSSANPVSPSNDVFLHIKNLVAIRELFVINPIVHLALGALLGVLAPFNTRKGRLISTACYASLALSFVAIATIWVGSLSAENWHLQSYQLTPVVVAKQVAAVLLWTAVAAAGSIAGSTYKGKSIRVSEAAPTVALR